MRFVALAIALVVAGEPASHRLVFGKQTFVLETQKADAHQKYCSDQLEYPALTGASDAKKQSALNAQWKKDWGAPSCQPSDEKLDPPYEYATRYTVLTQKSGRFAGLRFTYEHFEGGFHPNIETHCEVLDLQTFTSFALGDALTDEGRKQLGKKVSEVLKMPVEIYPGEHLCLEDDVIAVDFKDYEVTSHAEGPPYVKLPKALFRDWLARSPQLDALFGR
jgi:hypothetical protein